MKRLGVVVIIVGAVTLSGAPAGAKSKPQLSVRTLAPLTLAGRGFERSERVRVTARAHGATLTRALRASSRGTFTVAFSHMTVDPCNSDVWARAVGDESGRVTLKLPQRQCPPSP